jgi:hypothetical protein
VGEGADIRGKKKSHTFSYLLKHFFLIFPPWLESPRCNAGKLFAVCKLKHAGVRTLSLRGEEEVSQKSEEGEKSGQKDICSRDQDFSVDFPIHCVSLYTALGVTTCFSYNTHGDLANLVTRSIRKSG